MSRFYAAIENARALVPAEGRPPAVIPRLPGLANASDYPLLRLWQAVEARLPYRRCKVVLMAACAEGEADPRVAIRFARLASAITGSGVIVLTGRPSAHDPDGARIVFGPLPGANGDLRALNPQLLSSYWRLLSRSANLIVLDAPPILGAPQSLALAPTVDGVILLVEAERTHRGVATAARDALRDCGANVLGVVLNGRKFSVPGSMYRHL